MKVDELSVKINVGLSVSKETVEGCLHLITMWLNEDPHRAIRGGARHEDGRVEPLTIDKSNWEDDNHD